MNEEDAPLCPDSGFDRAGFLAGTLSEAEARAFRVHQDVCVDCRKIVEEDGEVTARLRAAIELPTEVEWKRIERALLRRAARARSPRWRTTLSRLVIPAATAAGIAGVLFVSNLVGQGAKSAVDEFARLADSAPSLSEARALAAGGEIAIAAEWRQPGAEPLRLFAAEALVLCLSGPLAPESLEDVRRLAAAVSGARSAAAAVPRGAAFAAGTRAYRARAARRAAGAGDVAAVREIAPPPSSGHVEFEDLAYAWAWVRLARLEDAAALVRAAAASAPGGWRSEAHRFLVLQLESALRSDSGRGGIREVRRATAVAMRAGRLAGALDLADDGRYGDAAERLDGLASEGFPAEFVAALAAWLRSAEAARRAECPVEETFAAASELPVDRWRFSPNSRWRLREGTSGRRVLAQEQTVFGVNCDAVLEADSVVLADALEAETRFRVLARPGDRLWGAGMYVLWASPAQSYRVRIWNGTLQLAKRFLHGSAADTVFFGPGWMTGSRAEVGVPVVLEAGRDYRLRGRLERAPGGVRMRAKLWPAGEAPPGEWQVEGLDAGSFGPPIVRGSAGLWTFQCAVEFADLSLGLASR